MGPTDEGGLETHGEFEEGLTEEDAVGGDAGDNDAEVDLHGGPVDNRVTVGIGLEVRNGKDADDLDYGDEEAKGEHADDSDLSVG